MRRFIQDTRHRHCAELKLHIEQCFRTAKLTNRLRQHSVPQVALIRREIKHPQVRPQTSHGTTEIVRMSNEVGDQAWSMSTRQVRLARRPITPVLAKDCL